MFDFLILNCIMFSNKLSDQNEVNSFTLDMYPCLLFCQRLVTQYTVCNTLYILNSKILFFCFKVYILLDGWGLLDTFRVGNSHSQFIPYILVETYHYYINRISTEFWYTQCQTMLQFDFLNFLGSNYLWSFCYIFLLCLSIYNYMNVVIVYLLAVFGSGKTFEYCYYLLEPC